MKTLKITIEYDGTAYHGWQRQPTALSIQEVIEGALEKIVGQKTIITASGRTDAGVHAKAQVASFQTKSIIGDLQFQKALNALLPPDIVVKEAHTATKDFHARFSARSKIYCYTIRNHSVYSAFDYKYAWLIKKPLSIEAMKSAAKYLLGKHDFTSFRSSNCSALKPVRNITMIDIYKEGENVLLWFEADGFLRYMVRNLVGTIVEHGLGKMESFKMAEILSAKDRRRAGPTAPPQGLCLINVKY